MDELGNTETPYFQPTEPEEQKQERSQEEAKIHAGLGVIEDMIKRFDKRIEFYQSPKAIEVDVTDDPLIHQKKVIVALTTAENITKEKEYLVSLKNSIEK